MYRFASGTMVFGSYNHFFRPAANRKRARGQCWSDKSGLRNWAAAAARAGHQRKSIRARHDAVTCARDDARRYELDYRLSDNPAHTSLFPDSRFYTYATFDKGKAYGLEIKADVPRIVAIGLSGYLNYAVGRVWVDNPIIAGFTTEAAHLTETSRFCADGPDPHAHIGPEPITTPERDYGAAWRWNTGAALLAGHGGDDAHEEGETHEHATGPGALRDTLPLALHAKPLDWLECHGGRVQTSPIG